VGVSEVTAVVGAVVGVAGLAYGVWKDFVARGESRKRHEAEDKLRRYQTDPVIVVHLGGSSYTRGDSHPEHMAISVNVTNHGAETAVAMNLRAGIAKENLEAASRTNLPALAASATHTLQLDETDVPPELVALLGIENPFGDLNYWATYANRDGERFRVTAKGPTMTQTTERITRQGDN
jgi:hypothetical protein